MQTMYQFGFFLRGTLLYGRSINSGSSAETPICKEIRHFGILHHRLVVSSSQEWQQSRDDIVSDNYGRELSYCRLPCQPADPFLGVQKHFET